jgi:hypothetical protein
METANRVVAVAKSVAARFSPFSRAVITAGIIVFCIGETYLHYALATPVLIDERTWVDRGLRPLWGPPNYPEEYYYAVHHPSFARIVYGSVLRLLGVRELNRPLVDYTQSAEWNFLRGAYPPLRIETPLRLVNVAFLSGMVILAYFTFKGLFRNRALALAGCLPLLFSYPICDGTSAYLGTDAMLLFWLAAFLFAWLKVPRAGTLGILALALVGGFLISTKVNGVFTLAGAVAYFAVTARGLRRLLWPAILVVLPLAVFVALNPIYRAGDLRWAAGVLKAVVDTMFELKAKSTSHDWAVYAKIEVLRESFPYWFFCLPAFAVLAAARRRKWFAPVACWAAFTVVPNVLLIYIPLLRYSAPISMAFLVLFDAAAISLFIESFPALARPNGETPSAPEAA